jgi:flagellar hook-basal body complex protein FliE
MPVDPVNSIGAAASGVGLDPVAFGQAAGGGLGLAVGQATESMAPDLASRMLDGAQISQVNPVAGFGQGPAAAGGAGQGGSFEGILDTINRAEQSQNQFSALTQAFSQGQDVPIHQVMAAAEEAQLTLETLTALRNKALDSFNELMRLQV